MSPIKGKQSQKSRKNYTISLKNAAKMPKNQFLLFTKLCFYYEFFSGIFIKYDAF